MSKIEDLKKRNTSKIEKCFYDGQIWTKNALSMATGISKAGVTNILKDLLECRKIIFVGEAHSTGGRKSKQYQINKDYFHIGKVVLLKKKNHYQFISQSVDLLDQLFYEDCLITQNGTIDELKTIISTLIEQDNKIATMCLSVPGICEDGYLSVCDFHQLQALDLKDKLKIFKNINIIIENDVNVASIGLSHQLNQPNLALLFQPETEYVGCGMIIHGQLYNGFSHFAGELRYLPFYSHEMQDIMLKENPKELLRLQIETICCVINPKVICLCSDVLNGDDLKMIEFNLPKQHISKIYIVENLNQFLYKGLYYIAINNI